MLSALWVLALSAGLISLSKYQDTPGPVAAPAPSWPTDAPAPSQNAYTLAIFLHPRCPCSTATLSSLDQLLAHTNGNLPVYVFAVLPPDAPPDWTDTSLLQHATAIPGVHVIVDANGRLAQLFGARTSGYTALYNPQRQLVFSGGITQSRGHEGDNPGLRSIQAFFMGRAPEITKSPVFGCALLTPESSRRPQ